MKVTDEITKIVEWYKGLGKDYANIEDLMYARKKLCTNLYLLNVEMSRARQSWKETEISHEVHKRKAIAELLEEGMPMTKCIEYAKAQCVVLFEQERIADAFYHNLKFMVDATNEVSNTMMQHISWLKKEQESVIQQT